ncbi:uncharacterized protein ColSpa_00642 [Colletotrichum spaethianum]|uniref:Uncharacterized protein n=1 Tax=Colletotrichum spaethianum TaxID=700344 RepID=A0AA37P477_9PEZI|nr:uncharacterized protein ColSpa_00642 [Colletotrichum spaethianum]GKT40461.1 hypothetical protein ColSpa_00642 [Colletotrichum spaethianum]
MTDALSSATEFVMIVALTERYYVCSSYEAKRLMSHDNDFRPTFGDHLTRGFRLIAVGNDLRHQGLADVVSVM